MRVSSVLDIGNDRTTLEGIARPASAGLAAAGAVALSAAFAVARSAGRVDYALHALPGRLLFLDEHLAGIALFVGMLHVTLAGQVGVSSSADWPRSSAATSRFWRLVLPVLLGSGTLYEWANPSLVHADEARAGHKAPYLNFTFFRRADDCLLCGLVAHLAVLFGTILWPRLCPATRMSPWGWERWSGPSLLLLSVTATYASFDWIMSLHPHWASTIFGVYYFSGAMVGGLAALILAVAGLQVSGRLRTVISNAEHYHDLGKLLLGFVIFWGQIAFSQYMLIWYANIPEETVWYEPRLFGPWGWGGVGVVVRAFDRPVPGAHVTYKSSGAACCWHLGRMASLRPLARPAVAGDAPHEFPATSIRRNRPSADDRDGGLVSGGAGLDVGRPIPGADEICALGESLAFENY